MRVPSKLQFLGSRSGRIALWLSLICAGALAFSLPNAAQPAQKAVVLVLDGAIGPATSDYLGRGLQEAADENAALVVIRMDTPGGLDTSMREIIRDILASPVPVASFVHPSGARAASAGTYILYASHIAAMAPGTNLGAATPVQVGGGGGLPFGGGEQDEDADPEGEEDADDTPASPQNASEAKAINDAVAYIRGLAELRGRNAEWAEQAVRQASSLSAADAVRENVADFVARDLNDLLAQADGRTVSVGGEDLTLATAGLEVEVRAPDWRTQLLSVITNPNVALIFMMIGIYGLIFEFMNPGALVPGTIGAISLIIALYSLAVLPVNFAGVGLILLGVILMVAEAFAPSFGVLGIGGAIAFVLGAAILIDTDVPGFEIAWPVIAVVAAASLALSLLVVRMAMTSHRRKIVSGRELLVGSTATVRDWKDRRGHVFVEGERWRAVSDDPLAAGETVRIVALDGLVLKVEPASTEET